MRAAGEQSSTLHLRHSQHTSIVDTVELTPSDVRAHANASVHCSSLHNFVASRSFFSSANCARPCLLTLINCEPIRRLGAVRCLRVAAHRTHADDRRIEVAKITTTLYRQHTDLRSVFLQSPLVAVINVITQREEVFAGNQLVSGYLL